MNDYDNDRNVAPSYNATLIMISMRMMNNDDDGCSS